MTKQSLKELIVRWCRRSDALKSQRGRLSSSQLDTTMAVCLEGHQNGVDRCATELLALLLNEACPYECFCGTCGAHIKRAIVIPSLGSEAFCNDTCLRQALESMTTMEMIDVTKSISS